MLEVETFPALAHGIVVGSAGVATTADEAVCFFHAGKRAETACEACGRFLCALCEIRIGAKHLCPTCLEAGRKSGSDVHFTRFRLLFGNLAVCSMVASSLLVYFAPLLWPIALGLAITGLVRPRSLTGRREWFLSAVTFVLIGLGSVIVALVIAALAGKFD